MLNKNRLKIAVLIKNSFTLVCFTALAMFFGKWWIVLFAVLFLTTHEDEGNDNGQTG